jgi:hypothetical protein
VAECTVLSAGSEASWLYNGRLGEPDLDIIACLL